MLYEYVNIYAEPLHYYGTTYQNLSVIDDYLFHRFPQYDVNDIIRKYKPMYINKHRISSAASESDSKKSLSKSNRFTIDDEWFQYYEEIAPDLYKRK